MVIKYMGNTRFTLMNKDKLVADLGIRNNEVYIQTLYSDIPKSINNFHNWIKYRTSPSNRCNISTLIKLNNITTIEQLLSITKCISIIDTFWVNDTYNNTTWDKISPYINKTNRALAEIALNGESSIGYSTIKGASPQYQVGGSVDKCVKMTQDGLYLYKTSGERWSDLAGCRPYCEYYASIIAEQLGLYDFVKYGIDLIKTKDNLIKPYVFCRVFTSEDYGLLHMRDSKFSNYTSDELIQKLNPYMRKQYKDMLVFDSLILNPDRHTENYGFIVDNMSNNIKKMSPVYDNDCSLGALISIQDKGFEQAINEIKYTKRPKTDIGDYDELARFGMTKDFYIRLRDIDRITLGERLPGVSQKRFDFMEYMVNKRRIEILNLFGER